MTYSAVLAALALLAAGCASQGPNVPAGAEPQATGGSEVSYTAPGDGKVYLQDDFNKRLVWSGEIRKGEVVRYGQKPNEVYLNGAVAAQGIPTPWHQHTIYFEPAPQAQTAGANTGGASTNSVLKVPVKVQVQSQPGQQGD